MAAAIIPAVSCACFAQIPRRSAVIVTVELLAGYSAVVLLADGYPRPLAHIVALMTFTFAPAVILGAMMTGVRQLSAELADAHARLRRPTATQRSVPSVTRGATTTPRWGRW